MAGRVGVVVMAYGTPASPEDIEPYYTHIRRGRAPEPAQLAELTARYEALGGTSPLAARTEAQRAAIERALDAAEPGRFTVVLGQKHAAPFIEDAVESLADASVSRIIGLVLAPHFSKASVGEYHARAAESAAERGIDYVGIDDWYALDAHVAFHATALRAVLADMPERTKVVFTAHSLPERVLADDPYPDQLFEGANLIAQAAGLARWAGWGIAWQSAGRTPEPWRGPDILHVIDDLAETGKADGIVIVPHGFTADHLEVLYDVDIEAATRAADRGLVLRRPPVVNADPAVMAALAARVRSLAS
ncbi:MAG: ferrochelatase [Actinobacteria bacterium]|nr:ferrochelatase [Actinomycetota bacterium]